MHSYAANLSDAAVMYSAADVAQFSLLCQQLHLVPQLGLGGSRIEGTAQKA
jgi:hypothetical protein